MRYEVNTWFRKQKFKGNPFSRAYLYAEEDDLVKTEPGNGYTDPKAFKALMNNLPTYIFSKSGCGRTRLKFRMQWEIQQMRGDRGERVLYIDLPKISLDSKKITINKFVASILENAPKKFIDKFLIQELQKRLSEDRRNDNSLNVLREFIRNIKYLRVFVLVDLMDFRHSENLLFEFQQTKWLLKNLPKLNCDGLTYKLFLPAEMEGELLPYINQHAPEHLVYNLVWDDHEAKNILAQRLKAYSSPESQEDEYQKLMNLFVRPNQVELWLNNWWAEYRTPRALWQLFVVIFDKYFSTKDRKREEFDQVDLETVKTACKIAKRQVTQEQEKIETQRISLIRNSQIPDISEQLQIPDKTTLIVQVRSLIKKGQLAKAIELCCDTWKDNDSLSLMSGDYHNLEERHRNTLIEDEEYNVSKNRIAKALLEIIREEV